MSQKEKTFADFDKFGLEAFADKLTQFLLVESKFVEGSFVLSLNSEFGSGKTTFGLNDILHKAMKLYT